MTVIWILLKLVEKAPVHYKLATTASSLAPLNIAEVGWKSSQRFKSLDDNLPVLKKVTHTVTDNAKFQSEEFHFIKITHTQIYTSIRKILFYVLLLVMLSLEGYQQACLYTFRHAI